MKRILYGSEPDFPSEGVALTIGSFDGVHLGHQKLAKRLTQVAAEKGLKSMVLTFDPHPAQVISKKKNFWRLFDVEDQAEQFEKLGFDFFSIIPFSMDVAQLEASQFLEKYLFNCLQLKALVVGYDFQFGARKSGTFELLKSECEKRSIYLESVAALEGQGEAFSSTRIRDAIVAGKVSEANSMLGRCFYASGVVVRGDQRGRKLGFPTANIQIEPSTLPMSGVYATRLLIDEKSYASVSNLGERPTFTGKGLPGHFLETHIFDFSEEIYDQSVRVEFVEFLRPEKKFNGLEDLSQQIKLDADRARSILQ